MDKEEKRDVTAGEIKKAEEIITEAAEEAQEEQQNFPEAGTAAPGTTAPGTTAAGTATPGTTVPGTTAAGTVTPGTTAQGTTTAGTATPGTTAPGTTASSSVTPSCTASSRDTLQIDLANLATTLKSISDIRETLISLELSEVDKVYFDRSVRPLLDYMNLLAFSTISIANAAAVFQGSFLGRKKEIEQALDLSYDINKQLRCIFEILQKRTAKYLSLENEEI